MAPRSVPPLRLQARLRQGEYLPTPSAYLTQGPVRMHRVAGFGCTRSFFTRTKSADAQEYAQSVQENDGLRIARAREDGRILNSGPFREKSHYCHNITNQDGKTLTVNLALWRLHSLATQGCEFEDEYVPLRDEAWNEKPPTPLSSLGILDVTAASNSPSDKESRPSLLVLGRRNKAKGAIGITIETSLSTSTPPLSALLTKRPRDNTGEASAVENAAEMTTAMLHLAKGQGSVDNRFIPPSQKLRFEDHKKSHQGNPSIHQKALCLVFSIQS